MKLSNIQILVLRFALAGLFLYVGITKINAGWLVSPESLLGALNGYKEHAAGLEHSYIENVAIPYASMWSKLMALGETAIGISMLFGLLVRLSSLFGIFMVLNYHFVNGNLLSLSFFGNPWAVLVLAAFAVLFLARGGRYAGFDTMLAKNKSKGVLW